jgi:hypothetical protein
MLLRVISPQATESSSSLLNLARRIYLCDVSFLSLRWGLANLRILRCPNLTHLCGAALNADALPTRAKLVLQ